MSCKRRLSPWVISLVGLALTLGAAADAAAWGGWRRSAAYSANQTAGNPYAAQYNPRFGPIRYNQWGQPQWPYSQRTTGVTQLGPAPAAAGVRSLPGWGGER